MVELIVVMVIIGVLGAIGAGRFFDRSEFDSDVFAEQARALLRHAQKTAIARNAPVHVLLDANRIALCHEASDGDCPAASRVAAPGGAMGAAASSTHCQADGWYCLGRPEGVSYAPSASLRRFFFDPLGRPLTADGSFDGLTLSITGSGKARAVSVTRETGYVQ